MIVGTADTAQFPHKRYGHAVVKLNGLGCILCLIKGDVFIGFTFVGALSNISGCGRLIKKEFPIIIIVIAVHIKPFVKGLSIGRRPSFYGAFYF